MKKTFSHFSRLRIWVIVLTLTAFACDRNKSSPEAPGTEIQQKNDSTSVLNKEMEEEQDPFFVVHYHLDSLAAAAEVDSFKTRYSSEQLKFIFAINRIDANRLRVGHPLVVPDTLTLDFLDYSPFPKQFKLIDTLDKTVLISKRIQAFALYEHGKLKHWGPVSSGKQSTPTPAGLFYGNYKARRKISTVDGSWVLPFYFNFMNFDGVGVHQYAMPGYPASHACVRLREEDAITIYDWAKQWQLDKRERQIEKNGTPFLVYGEYEFDKPEPWLQLVSNPHSNFISASEMETLASYMVDYRNDSRNFDFPDSLPASADLVAEESLEAIE